MVILLLITIYAIFHVISILNIRFSIILLSPTAMVIVMRQKPNQMQNIKTCPLSDVNFERLVLLS